MTNRLAFKARPNDQLPWTGRTELDLINARGWRAGSVELDLHLDFLTVRHQGRTLAVIDRERFREWLVHPREAMVADDVTWFTQTGLTCVTMNERSTYVVLSGGIGFLVAVM